MSNGFSALENASREANQSMSPVPAGVAVQTCGSAPSPETPVSPVKTHWIAIQLIDELGKRVPYEDYRITLPDGTKVEGTLDNRGRAKVYGIDPGNCSVCFPSLDREIWAEN